MVVAEGRSAGTFGFSPDGRGAEGSAPDGADGAGRAADDEGTAPTLGEADDDGAETTDGAPDEATPEGLGPGRGALRVTVTPPTTAATTTSGTPTTSPQNPAPRGRGIDARSSAERESSLVPPSEGCDAATATSAATGMGEPSRRVAEAGASDFVYTGAIPAEILHEGVVTLERQSAGAGAEGGQLAPFPGVLRHPRGVGRLLILNFAPN